MQEHEFVVSFYQIFDVAEEIDLNKAEASLKAKRPLEEELQYRRLTPKYIKYSVPPILVSLKPKRLQFGRQAIDFEFTAKIFDFGVVSIVARTEIVGSFRELRDFSSGLFSGTELDKKIDSELSPLLAKLGNAMAKPRNPKEFSEKYIIFHSVVQASEFNASFFLAQHAKELAMLVSLESLPLSQQQTQHTIENHASYYSSDLALIDYNASVLFDSTEPKDLLEIIEFARVQLLELRFFDAALDKKLLEIYETLEKLERSKDFSKAMKELAQYKLWIGEVMEKVDNALKLIGDIYLVHVYSLAAKEFNLQQWEGMVHEKMHTIEEIYTKLNDRVEESRHTKLEILLVVLEFMFIALWIYELFFRH